MFSRLFFIALALKLLYFLWFTGYIFDFYLLKVKTLLLRIEYFLQRKITLLSKIIYVFLKVIKYRVNIDERKVQLELILTKLNRMPKTVFFCLLFFIPLFLRNQEEIRKRPNQRYIYRQKKIHPRSLVKIMQKK